MLKPIPGHRQYVINEDGSIVRRIASDKRIRKLNLSASMQNAYLHVTLLSCDKPTKSGEIYDSTTTTRTSVHRLVALTWCQNDDPANKVWVNHEDGNKLNNHYSNLKWGTISYNIQHSIDTGLRTIKSGKDHWLFGKTASDKTRAKMAKRKQGTEHPKFKGYYVKDGIKYTSANKAAKATGIYEKKIQRLTKANADGWTFEPAKRKTVAAHH